MSFRSVLGVAASLAALLGHPMVAFAQSAENVAVVINDNSPESKRIGEYYARVRQLPASNVLHVGTVTQETVDRATYVRTIEIPVGNAIAKEGLQDRVLYLVLTKGIPLRITGTAGQKGTTASVDSELTLLYRRMTGQAVPIEGPAPNPYFLNGDLSTARPFTHRDYDIFLVSRLDAYTVDEAIALIDKGAAPSTDGRIVLDERAALVNRTGETWLELASKRLTDQGRGNQVVLETTPKPARDEKQVIGYFSWGSTDPQNRVRSSGMSFVAGAIAATFVGSDARTFQAPPESWIPTGDAANRASWYAGSPESLSGDLIRDGVTGVAGYVAQPFLAGTVRPQILFPSYVAGFNLVEAFYLASPFLSWQTVVVGDPLCAPFPRKALSRSDIDDGIDKTTELPALFSKRRMATALAQSPGIPEQAVALTARSELAMLKGDTRAARARLNEALEAAPQYVVPLMQIAALDDVEGQHEQANARYKQIIEIQPNHVVALNNLAYGLAVYQKMPMEGLPYARRAAALAPTSPTVLETLGWIQHLLGDDVSAAKVMSQVARANVANADIRLHTAIVLASQGVKAVAQDELAAALKLNPALEQTDDVKQLRAKLAAPTAPAPPTPPARK